RFVLLAIAGCIPMVLWPICVTVFAIVGALALVVLVDIVLTPSPRKVSIVRSENKQVRLAEPLEVCVELTNTSSRRIHGQIRDGFQPQDNDSQSIHHIIYVTDETQRYISCLTPSSLSTVTSY